MDSNNEIPKAYEPAAVEAKWQARWTDAGCFTAHPEKVSAARPAFSIVIPPPNITGVLTLGHVLNNTIQDILARRARQTGHEVLWLPGTDHAGLATQTAVEKAIREEKKNSPGKTSAARSSCAGPGSGKRNTDASSSTSSRRWVARWTGRANGSRSTRATPPPCRGCSWTCTKKGYIYRGTRMVNWDPKALTAVSDEEVQPRPQKSSLYYVKYEVADEPGRFLEVATTRPETIMADMAVAVNPADTALRRPRGQNVWRPFPRAG